MGKRNKMDVSMVELGEAMGMIAEGCAKAIKAAAEMTAAFLEILLPVIQQQEETQAAISWARSARPAWYAVYYRTKKKRTRKKYLDKIVRDYRQEG